MGTLGAVRSPRQIPPSSGPILSVSSAASGDDAAFASVVAANLAAYLRALHDGLSLLYASFAPAASTGSQGFPALSDSMFRGAPSLPSLAAGWKSGSLNASMPRGAYGIHYLQAPNSADALGSCADIANKTPAATARVATTKDAVAAIRLLDPAGLARRTGGDACLPMIEVRFGRSRRGFFMATGDRETGCVRFGAGRGFAAATFAGGFFAGRDFTLATVAGAFFGGAA